MTNNSSSSTSSVQKQLKGIDKKDKLRVLCFHGYRQNADILKNKLGSFRKILRKYADFTFISAPHHAVPTMEQDVDQTIQRSWWANKKDGSFKGTNKEGPAFGFQESLHYAENVWKTEGPFQGILGFSQGACFVGLICGLAKKKMTCIDADFAILSSGFISGSLVHKNIYEETITIPTLHIYGLSDEIIPKEMSQELASHYKNVEILEHDGGHYFPATTILKQKYVNFFQDRLQECLENQELGQSMGIEFLSEDEDIADDDDDDGSDDSPNNKRSPEEDSSANN